MFWACKIISWAHKHPYFWFTPSLALSLSFSLSLFVSYISLQFQEKQFMSRKITSPPRRSHWSCTFKITYLLCVPKFISYTVVTSARAHMQFARTTLWMNMSLITYRLCVHHHDCAGKLKAYFGCICTILFQLLLLFHK